MTRLFGIDVVRSHRLGGAWVSDDGSGAAVWYPPGQWEPSDRESLRQLPQLFAAFGRRLPLAGRVLNALQEQHRRLDPHWDLYTWEPGRTPKQRHRHMFPMWRSPR